jgi:hypothetical protein
MSIAWRKGFGLIAAPAAWAASTQLGQILDHVDCKSGVTWSLFAAAAAAAVSLAAMAASYPQKATDDRTQLFVGYLSVGANSVFAFALLLQAAASALLNPCQR